MPTPSFPSTLPLVSRFTVTPNDGVLADEDDGVKEFRLRSLDRGAKGSAEWTFIESDLQIFDTFCRTTLLNGHRQFCLELPSAAGIACHIVRMLNRQIRPIGHGAYTVTCDLEIRSRAFDPCICPAPLTEEPPEIGWLSPMYDGSLNPISTGTAAYSNTGSIGIHYAGIPMTGYDLHAGVVDYTSGTVVWNLSWSPVDGGPAPSLGAAPEPGKIRIAWPSQSGNPFFLSQGLLTVTATVNGVAVTGALEAAGANDVYYPLQTWGPA